MAVRTITKQNFEQEVLACKKPVMLLFYADNCEASQHQMELFEKMSEEQKDATVFAKADVNASVSLAFQYQIIETPTIIAMSYGIFRGRISGFQKEEVILDMIAGCGDGIVSFS